MDDKPRAKSVGWRLMASERIFSSSWYCLRQDEIGIAGNSIIKYTYVDHPGSVFIVPITLQNEILLIHSYRYTIDEWIWEIPAGTMADRMDVDAKEVAAAELAEETGAVAEELELVGEFFLSNGFANCKAKYFIGWNVVVKQAQELDVGEEIGKIEKVPLGEAVAMVLDGRIADGDSALGILIAALRIGNFEVY
jgi:ADP-ribose pyrophosphatase